jgi:selenocysteine-specific elongation factor
VRTLQTHKHKVDTATPGSRVAINLAGVSTEEVARGDVVSVPRWLTPTNVVDVQLRALPSLAKPLEHGGTLSVHTGSAEVECRLSLLDRDELAPGEAGWAQLRLLAPIAVVKGDFFVLRTPNTTVGGGEIVDVHRAGTDASRKKSRLPWPPNRRASRPTWCARPCWASRRSTWKHWRGRRA